MGCRITGQQHGHLLIRPRLPQAIQQAAHALRVVEVSMGCRITSTGQQHGHLLIRPRYKKKQPAYAVRVVESNVGCGVTAQ